MERETFVSDKRRVGATLALAIGLIGMAIILFVWMRPPESLIRALVVAQGILLLLSGGYYLWRWLHRERPVLQISADFVEYRSIHPFVRRQRVALRELTSVRLIDGLIAGETQSGETVTLFVQTLSPETRQRAVEAIHRRLADLQSSSSP